MARIFIYDGKELPDPDPSMTIDDVRQSYTEFFPELSNAASASKKDGDNTVITFTKRVGTKGASSMKLEEAVKIVADCDGLNECEKCPVATLVKIESANYGVDQVGSMCAWIQMVRDLIEDRV